jgi:hypothetical protein
MSMCSKAALAATALLAVCVAAASANRLSTSSTTFRVVWTSLEAGSGAASVRCPVTIEGSMHATTMAKVAGALVGYVTSGAIGSSSCSGGTATIDREALPWHIRYRGFTGTLPNIASVSYGLVGAQVTANVSGMLCTTRTTEANPGIATSSISAGVATGVRLDEHAGIPLRGDLCELSGTYSVAGTGAITVLGSTTPIAISLI